MDAVAFHGRNCKRWMILRTVLGDQKRRPSVGTSGTVGRPRHPTPVRKRPLPVKAGFFFRTSGRASTSPTSDRMCSLTKRTIAVWPTIYPHEFPGRGLPQTAGLSPFAGVVRLCPGGSHGLPRWRRAFVQPSRSGLEECRGVQLEFGKHSGMNS
jgi:hypothetical protein